MSTIGRTRTKRRKVMMGARKTNEARLWRRPNSDSRIVRLCSWTPIKWIGLREAPSGKHADPDRCLSEHLRAVGCHENGVLDLSCESLSIDARLKADDHSGLMHVLRDDIELGNIDCFDTESPSVALT